MAYFGLSKKPTEPGWVPDVKPASQYVESVKPQTSEIKKESQKKPKTSKKNARVGIEVESPKSVTSVVTKSKLVDDNGVITKDGVLYLLMRVHSLEKFGDRNIEMSPNTAKGLKQIILSIPESNRLSMFQGDMFDAYDRFMKFLDYTESNKGPVAGFSGDASRNIFTVLSSLNVWKEEEYEEGDF